MAAAALLGGASAHNHQRHAHDAFHLKRGQNDTNLVCVEVVQTVTGDFFCMSPALSRRERERESPRFLFYV